MGRGAQCETEIAGGARAQERGRGAEPRCVCPGSHSSALFPGLGTDPRGLARRLSGAAPGGVTAWFRLSPSELWADSAPGPIAHGSAGGAPAGRLRGPRDARSPTGHAPLGMRSARPRWFIVYPCLIIRVSTWWGVDCCLQASRRFYSVGRLRRLM